MKVKNKVIKLIFISFVAIFPFFLSNYSISTPEKITSDLRFCK